MTKNPVDPGAGLHTVRVEGREKRKRHAHSQMHVIDKGGAPKVSNTGSDFAYRNSAYVGSVNSVHEPRPSVVLERPNSVIREQYWACSKWSFTQRVLVLAVVVLISVVVGLSITLALRNGESDSGDIRGLFAAHVDTAPN